MKSREITVTEAVSTLEQQGFTGQFCVVEGPPGLVCGHCNERFSPDQAEVVELFRFEGESDPADEAVVAGLRCTSCGHLGILTAAYGMSADPAEADVLALLGDARPRT